MRAVVQRVSHASVDVEGKEIGAIKQGLLVFLGVEKGDTDKDLEYIVNKVSGLRVFEDADGKLNLSVVDVAGEILAVSQFTICGDCKKGKRPSFDNAAPAEVGNEYYEKFIAALRAENIKVATGQFQAHMYVSLVNDGPVTILLDSKKTF